MSSPGKPGPFLHSRGRIYAAHTPRIGKGTVPCECTLDICAPELYFPYVPTPRMRWRATGSRKHLERQKKRVRTHAPKLQANCHATYEGSPILAQPRSLLMPPFDSIPRSLAGCSMQPSFHCRSGTLLQPATKPLHFPGENASHSQSINVSKARDRLRYCSKLVSFRNSVPHAPTVALHGTPEGGRTNLHVSAHHWSALT